MGGVRTVRVGLIKAVPEKWDLAANWAAFERLARRAQERGAQLICTPECFLDGYVVADEAGWSPERFRGIGQPLTADSYVGKAMVLARALRVHLVFGFTELAQAGCYNAAALIDDRGRLLGTYHKTHLLDEDRRYLPGTALPVWDTALGKIGIMICADRRWPEAARTLKVAGAELVVIPSYGMWHLDNEWWMRTRSYENELCLCFVHPHVAFIAGPGGELEAKLHSNLPDVLVHDVDLARTSDVMFRARRTDLYRIVE